MKTLRKYASIAFLLLSVATVIPAYVKPTYNDFALISLQTMMLMCLLSEKKYITNETLNKILTPENLMITGIASSIPTAINLYKNINELMHKTIRECY